MLRKQRPFIFLLMQGILVGCAVSIGEHRATVAQMPIDAVKNHRLRAYDGTHPSLLARPPETFKFPIALGGFGPVDALFSGPLQYPFLCRTEDSKLGQPLVDNQSGFGVPVFSLNELGEKTKRILGFSQNCQVPTTARYYYKPVASNKFLAWQQSVRPEKIDQAFVNGRSVPFIVRLETGTINRFIYAIAVLKSEQSTLAKPQADAWNKRLIYQFRGGVGVGRNQGRFRPKDILKRRVTELANGYAVVYSTGNQTSNHYNIWLAEDTARRVKQQFTALYGQPLYTVGIGGSGGAIQQYLLAQNSPGILDAAIPLYSYPDMITQTTYVLDCELMEYYFDVTDKKNSLWRRWENRSLVEGLNARSGAPNQFARLQWWAKLFSLRWPGEASQGSTECVSGWRGTTPLTFNPTFIHYPDAFEKNVRRQVRWTHWQDLEQIYGTDQQGLAQVTWDNVGVQYGLQALREGKLSAKQFLKLNARVGSWRHPREQKAERFWFLNGHRSAWKFSPWSAHNMRLTGALPDTPAPRFEGDLEAMRAAYRSGMVFMGKVNIPVIDVRHYLEPELNMHHALASFSTRARILAANGEAGNHLIWMTRKPHDPTPLAFVVIDAWMDNLRRHPEKSVTLNKPSTAQDACFDANGRLLWMHSQVWNGRWNGQPEGACSRIYPSFSTSRMVAGESIQGNTFKCHLQSVQQAITTGVYGMRDMSAYQPQLEKIFPTGVCDYSRPDQALPTDLFMARGEQHEFKGNQLHANTLVNAQP